MQRLVAEHLAGCRTIADLFCGVGTFALPLARHANVHAVESDGPALAALENAKRGVSDLKTLTIEKRDLFFRPLAPKELDQFKGVVFDPPRAGAPAQARQIARSKVKKVVAVSCNPATLARDLRILIDGGYRLETVTPIDQFLYSAHVELVATLSR